MRDAFNLIRSTQTSRGRTTELPDSSMSAPTHDVHAVDDDRSGKIRAQKLSETTGPTSWPVNQYWRSMLVSRMLPSNFALDTPSLETSRTPASLHIAFARSKCACAEEILEHRGQPSNVRQSRKCNGVDSLVVLANNMVKTMTSQPGSP